MFVLPRGSHFRMWSCLLAALLFGPLTPALARTLYVSTQHGSNANDGLSEDQAWATINRAVLNVQPGDTVIIGPGIYFEHVKLKTVGTAENPIVFKADRIEKNRVLITGADKQIRRGNVQWTLEDATLNLYSTTYERQYPARVLYSGTDLYPYASLDRLKQFSCGENMPGPLHGFYFVEQSQRLYVRLHTSGKFGSTNPAEHIIAVAPPTGGGTNGTYISHAHEYNFGIVPGMGQSAHVILDGLSFETPGVARVYTQANDVQVRNCWFTGCRTGVAGATRRDLENNTIRHADRVQVSYCDFTMFPAFEDAMEAASNMNPQNPCGRFYWWQRKSASHGVFKEAMDYEIGIASQIGTDWEIDHSRIHSCFEGLSADGTTLSVELKIHDNVFEGMVDNAIEFEDHARNMHVYHNVFVDNFSPLSWQPLKAMPWPGPIYVHQNLIYETPQTRATWNHGQVIRTAYKIGCSAKQWKDSNYAPLLVDVDQQHIAVPTPGLLIYNNTVWLPQRTRLFAVMGGMDAHLQNVLLANNVLHVDSIVGDAEPDGTPRSDGGPRSYEYLNNLLALSAETTTQASLLDAQMLGQMMTVEQLQLQDPSHANFEPMLGSPALEPSVPVLGSLTHYPILGAVGGAASTAFLKAVGPQISSPMPRP